MAQTPTQFKYQAALRNADGTIVANQQKTVVIDILQGSTEGTSVFSETHTVTTTANGITNLNIGSIANLGDINWSADVYFVQITVDEVIMGVSQLLDIHHLPVLQTQLYQSLTKNC